MGRVTRSKKDEPAQEEVAPPAYRDGDGWGMYAERTPIYTLELDAGAFIWLWQMMQAKKRYADGLADREEYQAIVDRVYRTFAAAQRRLEQDANEIEARLNAKPRRVVRRSKK